MAYRIPKDLPLLQAAGMDWTAEERIRTVIGLPCLAVKPEKVMKAKLVAVAMTLNEQPGKVYAGNCCGVMCQGTTYPWGWTSGFPVRPVGYVLLREGATGKSAPFLAFAKVEDSLRFLIDRVEARQIWTGEVYAVKWVGAKPGSAVFKSAVRGFNAAYDKAVAALWSMAAKCAALPMTGPSVPGWRDAGAGGA